MNTAPCDIIERIKRLNVFKSGARRAPHKPLLILFALARLNSGDRQIPFKAVEATLKPLLNAYAPPVAGRHQPELPYWHLQSDGIWHVEGTDNLPRQAGGFPKMAGLRQTSAGFTEECAAALISDPALIDQVSKMLLEEHFPPSMHDDIIAAVGLESLDQPMQVRDAANPVHSAQKRNPAFRQNVLRAYEHRCAVTGFRAALGGSFFGCEAAHVQWHAYGGPDTVANGISMEPTLHKLFDAGAWTLSDDRRILVSRDYTGSDTAIARLREYHGQPLRRPIQGEPSVSEEYIKWHREPELGGVFRAPHLAL